MPIIIDAHLSRHQTLWPDFLPYNQLECNHATYYGICASILAATYFSCLLSRILALLPDGQLAFLSSINAFLCLKRRHAVFIKRRLRPNVGYVQSSPETRFHAAPG